MDSLNLNKFTDVITIAFIPGYPTSSLMLVLRRVSALSAQLEILIVDRFS